MFFRLGFTGMAAVVTVSGVVLFGELTEPVPGDACPTVTRARLEAAGYSFARSFHLGENASSGILVRAAEGDRPPRCLQVLGYARCRADGPTLVGVLNKGTYTYFAVPSGRKAEVAIAPGTAACGHVDATAEAE